MDDMSGAGSTAQVQTPEQVLDWARATYGLTLTTGQQWEVANAIGFTGSNWVPDMAGKAMAYIATEAGRHNIPRAPVTPTITPEHVRRMATMTKFHIAAFKELNVDEAIREAITRMGPTQAAALVMQEQAKAEATRVASLRARGIAADPRPAMEMAEVEQFLQTLSLTGATGLLAAATVPGGVSDSDSPRAVRNTAACRAMARRASTLTLLGIILGIAAVMNPVGLTVTVAGYSVFISEGILIGAGFSAEIHAWALERVAIDNC